MADGPPADVWQQADHASLMDRDASKPAVTPLIDPEAGLGRREAAVFQAVIWSGALKPFWSLEPAAGG